MRRPLICLVTTLLLNWIAPASQGAMVIASNLSSGSSLSANVYAVGNTGSNFTNEVAAQEFTAAIDGQVGQISLTVDVNKAVTVPMFVSIYTASGTGLGSLLGSVAVYASSVGPSADYPNLTGLATVDFTSQGINLASGQQYFVELEVGTPSPKNVFLARLLNTSNPQPLGYRAEVGLNGRSSLAPGPVANEIGLVVTSATVPEPATMGLVAVGLVAVGWAARRRPTL